MTDTVPPPDDADIRERLTALEIGLRHSREISKMQDRQYAAELKTLHDLTARQDDLIGALEEKLLGKVEQVHRLLFSGLKWLGALLAGTLLTIVLKISGLS